MVSGCSCQLDMILMLIFVNFFTAFSTTFLFLYFSGLITIRLYNLCMQLLQFSSNYNEILQAYSKCSECLHLFWGLPSLFFTNFFHFFDFSFVSFWFLLSPDVT